jgi:hypothetical protein
LPRKGVVGAIYISAEEQHLIMITKIRLQNFKALKDAELKLGASNVIVGPNGSDKSSVRQALKALAELSCHRINWNKTTGVALGIMAMLVSLLAPQVVSAGEDAGFQTPSNDQFEKLFSALVSPHPEIIRITDFTTLKRMPETDDQLLADARAEQEELGRAKSQSEKEAEVNAILAREKLKNDGMMYFWEREIKIKGAYRLDRTIWEQNTLPKALAGPQTLESLRAFLVASSNHFETTVVCDKTKGEFYHFQINWLAGSSSYANLRGTVPADRGLDGALYSPGELQLLLIPFMRDIDSPGHDKYDNARFTSFLSNDNYPYQISVLASNFSGIEVDDFRIRFKRPPSFSLMAEFICDRTNYHRMYSCTFYSTNGQVSWRQNRSDYDTNDFPWTFSLRSRESNPTNWTEELRQCVRVEYPQKIDREAVFGFNPPDSFAIENYTSGQTVIERYPMVSGRRLGPANLVVDNDEPRTEWRKSLFRIIIVSLFAAPIIVFVYLRLSNKHKTKNQAP